MCLNVTHQTALARILVRQLVTTKDAPWEEARKLDWNITTPWELIIQNGAIADAIVLEGTGIVMASIWVAQYDYEACYENSCTYSGTIYVDYYYDYHRRCEIDACRMGIQVLGLFPEQYQMDIFAYAGYCFSFCHAPS